jgi:hypothetical protein
MKLDLKSLRNAVVAIFVVGVLFVIITALMDIVGMWGIISSFALPNLGEFNIVTWFTGIFLWIFKLIIKLFLLGLFLELLVVCSTIIVDAVLKK